MPSQTITRSNGIPWRVKVDKNRFFFPPEYKKFEDQLKDRQKHTIMVLVNTGARHMEAWHIKVGDCDLNNKRIHLRVTKSKARKGEKKGYGKPRIIPISSQFAKYLKGYIKEHQLSYESTLNLLETSPADKAMKKACIKAGITNPEEFSVHNLRKTLEVWLMALGVDNLKLLAHFSHDIRTAAHNYVSPDIFSWEDKKDMRDIIGDLYATQNGN